ncbi:MAG TPA: PsiF family protein [Steroidobacteraceae bacterium]|nr:PsiF family protein [Steroidobacteraceae bacterium]
MSARLFTSFAALAAALSLGLTAMAEGFSDAPAAPPSPAAPAVAAPAVTASAAASAATSGDAAAKHAKRTACLKDAKTKKLVGAEKTSFLKGCIAAPSQARAP